MEEYRDGDGVVIENKNQNLLRYYHARAESRYRCQPTREEEQGEVDALPQSLLSALPVDIAQRRCLDLLVICRLFHRAG